MAKLAAAFLASLLVLWSLLVLACAIPNNAIRANMQKSATSFATVEPYAFTDGDKLLAVTDNYADVILLCVAWHMGEGSPLVASLDTSYHDGHLPDGTDMGENYGLYISLTEDAPANTDYSRYFHGSSLFVRLFHLFGDVALQKAVGLATTLLLAALTCVQLVRYKHPGLAFALALSLACVHVWNIGLSLEYQSPFLVCFALCPFWLWAVRRGVGLLPLLSVISGVAIAFFDFLTCETLVILLPLMLVVAVRARENRLAPFKQSLGLLALCLAAFLAAYAGTFVAKWTMATLATGENKFLTALTSAGERVSGTAESQGLSGSLLVRIPSAVLANLTVLFAGEGRLDIAKVLIGLAVSLAVLASVRFLFKIKLADKTPIYLLLLLASVVFARYMLLSNHSYLHEFFTYRALAAPIFALLSCVGLSTSLKGVKK